MLLIRIIILSHAQSQTKRDMLVCVSLSCTKIMFCIDFFLQFSSMRAPAQRFLILRAIGAPAFVVSLALQGIFRGFKDTKTPVYCLGKYQGFNCLKFVH